MLTPDYLEGFPDALVALFARLEDFIVADVARRVAKAGKITNTAAFQREILGELTAADSAVDAEVAKTLAALGEIYLQAAGTATVTTGGSYIRRLAETAAEQAKDDLKNLTRTLGIPSKNGQLTLLTDAYREALSLAQLQVSSGAADYMSAVRSALRPFTKSGIYTVDYASGVRRSIESSARQSVMTGVMQMAQEIARQDAREMGADGWEITAHANCAPDHEPIQGLQYTEKETEINFEQFSDGSRANLLYKTFENPGFMDGNGVFIFGISDVVKSVKMFMEREKITMEQVDYFVFHQAQKMIVEGISQEIGIPQEKVCIPVKILVIHLRHPFH